MILARKYIRHNLEQCSTNLKRLTYLKLISPLTEYERRCSPVNHTSFHHLTRQISSSAIQHNHNSTKSKTNRKHQRNRLPSNFLSDLQSQHPDIKISTNPYDLDSHGHGESYHPSSPPDAVIYPSTIEEIRDILNLCCREAEDQSNDNGLNSGDDNVTVVEVVAIIPYGAGTSVEGHLNMLIPNDDKIIEVPSSAFMNNDECSAYRKVRIQRRGGISIDMSNFQTIGEVEIGDLFVNVGAGVTRKRLNESLRHTGLQFMVDPGADASVGGMVACGASGTTAVKYGTMRENVLSLTAVLPPTKILPSHNAALQDLPKPEVIKCGTTALKSSAGYNLTGLLIGSEGTLGVVTEAVVKLHPSHNNVISAVCAFNTLHSAAEAVTTIRMTGIPVSRIELLDEVSIQAFNKSLMGICETDSNKIGKMEVKPTLFLEFCGHSEASVMEDLSAAKSICIEDFDGSNFASAADEQTRQALWSARHRLYYSSIALKEGATPRSTLLTDACVPLSQFADVLVATAHDVKDSGVVGPCFGHAGDGNFHCIMPMSDYDSEAYKQKVFNVNENLIKRVLKVGGTCTGEHGVGYGKIKYLEQMFGKGGVDLMTRFKNSIDPWNVMNPGKIVKF